MSQHTVEKTRRRDAESPEPGSAGSRLHNASLVDASFVVALILVAISALDETFDTRAYLFVAAIAAVVPVAAAAVVASSKRPWSIYALSLVLIYPIGGAIFALGNHELAGLPSPGSLLEVLASTWLAPERLITTLPPVRAVGEVMVLPYLISYAASALSSWLAASTRRPVAPAVPTVLALAVAALFGGQRSEWLMPRTIAFAVLLFAWIAIRTARNDQTPGAAHARWLRALVALLVAGGIAGGLAYQLVPGFDVAQRVVLRGQVGRGQDVAGVDNPLSNIRKYRPNRVDGLPSLANVRLLRVSGLPRNRLVRFATLDRYDGLRWRADNRTVLGTSEDLFQRISDHIAPMQSGRSAAVEIDVLPGYASAWLPLVGELTALDFVYADGRAQADDVRYNPATAAGVVIGGLANNDDYDFTAVLPKQRLSPSMAPFEVRGRLQPQGAELDPFLRPWRRMGVSKLRRVLALAHHLVTEGRYSDGARGEERFTSGQDIERLTWNFIATEHPVGNDEQYAAFLALAANRLGVPARVAVGAAPNERGVIRGRDVHAWVELQIADGSWRMLPNEAFMSREPASLEDTGQPTPEQIKALEQATSPEEDAGRGAQPQADREPSAKAKQEAHEAVWWRTHLWWLVLAGALAVGLAALPVAKWLRRRRRTRVGSVGEQAVGWWREVLAFSADLGEPVPTWLSRPEQARFLRIPEQLAQLADRADFGPELAASDDPGALNPARQAKDVMALVKSRHRRRARWLAPWRVASLRGASRQRRVAASIDQAVSHEADQLSKR